MCTVLLKTLAAIPCNASLVVCTCCVIDQKPTGRFLLGKTDEDGGSISTRKIILRRKKGETAGNVEVVTELVMYEIGQIDQ